MIINYELWREKHNECVRKVQRLCELCGKKQIAIKCNSALCVMKNAKQDIEVFFENNKFSSAEFCYLIRNIDVLVTCIMDINNDLLGIGGKSEKRIERCFTDKNTILKFRTLRSLIIAHPVDTQFKNEKGESVTVYLEDILPFNPSFHGLIIKEKCDYVKRMCNPESDLSYFEPLSIDNDIMPVINVIIDSIDMLNYNVTNEIRSKESIIRDQPLVLEKTTIQEYIISLDKELEKRYPSEIEYIEYADGRKEHNSIVSDCLIYLDAHFVKGTQEKYDIFLVYIKKELRRIESDLQQMCFNKEKYFGLLYNPDFAPAFSYEKTKMEYLHHSEEKSYTDNYIDSSMCSDALYGIDCFRLLIPYISKYIPVDLSVFDKELYCQYVAAQYLSNVINCKEGLDV